MKAFILCGGEGTRLRPYTYTTPKPMMLVGGKPILWYVIENLKKNGISDLILTVGYLHEQISDYFGDGSKFGVKIEYVVESEKMNTAGSILPLKDKVDSTFIVVMGDHITNINMKDMVDAHKLGGAVATIALLKNKMPLEFGVVETDSKQVTGFKEKPILEHNFNVAIYCFEPKIFDYIEEKEDFAKDVFPRMLERNERIVPFVFEDVWFDIGRVSDYERLNELFQVIKIAEELKL
jgi:mannose-1-phosphate guanylyltransferase/phosphomannomutase